MEKGKFKKIDLISKNIIGILDININNYGLIEEINCCNNFIEEIINFPNELVIFRCTKNKIKKLSNLPINLIELYCEHNYFNNSVLSLMKYCFFLNLQIKNIAERLKNIICDNDYPFENDFLGIEV